MAPPPPVNVTVLGAGAWGSALARLVEHNGHQVCLWSRRLEISLETLLPRSEIIISAVAMAGVAPLGNYLAQLKTQGLIHPQTLLVTATKGLDVVTTATPSQLWQQALPDCPIVVLSGPNLSVEINQGLPAATVVASTDLTAAQRVQTLLASDTFRVYTNTDPLGTELGGTLKNVMAIAAGVCDGLGLGANAKAALITRALPEMIRVGVCLGAKPETFWGLAGLGDMLATCSSALSRNYRVGYGLAQGNRLETVLDQLGGTAEGVNTTQVLMAIAQREKIATPITQEVYRLLQGQITPQQAVEALMERELKPEWVF